MQFKFLNQKWCVESIIIIALLMLIITGHTLAGCCRVSTKELFSLHSSAPIVDCEKNKVFKNWTETSDNYKSAMENGINSGGPENLQKNIEGTAIVNNGLADGSFDFFSHNQFKPECCPSTYTTSTGCACLSFDQMKALNTRGGNREGNAPSCTN